MLARLEPHNELKALRSVQATLSAAEGKLVEANNTFDRQRLSCPKASPTLVLFDQVLQALRTAQSQNIARCVWHYDWSGSTAPCANGSLPDSLCRG